jgi:hypothetical protein
MAKCLKRAHGNTYKFKKYQKKSSTSLDIIRIFEDNLYNLNTSALHLKLYVKRLMHEYVGDTRQEVAVFYAMAVNLYKEISDSYYGVMNYKRNVIDVDINGFQKTYEGILDLCGTTADQVYEMLFDENDDGYETPPREGEELLPASLCEEMEDGNYNNNNEDDGDDDELYIATIECINKKLTIN